MENKIIYLAFFYLLKNSVSEEKMLKFKKENNSITFPTKEGKIHINFSELINKSFEELKLFTPEEKLVIKKELNKWQ